MPIKNILDTAVSLLKQIQLPNPRREASLLLGHCLNKDPLYLLTHETEPVSNDIQIQFFQKLEQRLDGCPLSKIIGFREFYGRNFLTNKDVLDPRPDSETLIDAVLQHTKHQKNVPWRILDLGVGSGCLLITLLAELPNSTGVGVDISQKAIDTATQNATILGVKDRIIFKKGNWITPLQGESFDIIITNPPYIATKDIPFLNPAVKNYDPLDALDGGPDGLNAYKILANTLHKITHSRGENKKTAIFFEIGAGQGEKIMYMMLSKGFDCVDKFRDLQAYTRCLKFVQTEPLQTSY